MSDFAKILARIVREPAAEENDSIEAQIDSLSSDPSALSAFFANLESKNVNHGRIKAPRASSLQYECLRKTVIMAKQKKTIKDMLSFRDRVLFGYGDAIHTWLQNSNLVFGNRRWGNWKCLACGKIFEYSLKPAKCKCGANPGSIVYDEIRISTPAPYPCSGHPDMFLEIAKRKRRVIELKSINGEDYETLVIPLIAHVWQIMYYMMACSEKGLPGFDPSVGYVLYITKRIRLNEFPMKMFKVEWNTSIVSTIKHRLHFFHRAVKTYPKGLPEKMNKCSTHPTCWEVKKCPVSYTCFQLEG